MTAFDELSARVRLLNDNISAVERAGTPVEELVAEKLDRLSRAIGDFSHAPFRMIHGSSAAMIEHYTLGMMGAFHPEKTAALIEKAARASAGAGLRLSAAEKEETLAELWAQRRTAEAELERLRRDREIAGSEILARTGDPGVYLLRAADLARVIDGLAPEELGIEAQEEEQ